MKNLKGEQLAKYIIYKKQKDKWEKANGRPYGLLTSYENRLKDGKESDGTKCNCTKNGNNLGDPAGSDKKHDKNLHADFEADELKDITDGELAEYGDEYL